MKPAVISLAILIGILGGFYGGFRYGQTKVAAAATTVGSSNTGGVQAGQGGRGSFAGGNGGFLNGQAACPTPGATPAATNGRGGANGTITAVSNGTLTLHDTRCNLDVKVSFGSNATVTKVAQGSTADLKTGENVTVIGQRQADGSVNATVINIQPARGQ